MTRSEPINYWMTYAQIANLNLSLSILNRLALGLLLWRLWRMLCINLINCYQLKWHTRKLLAWFCHFPVRNDSMFMKNDSET